jgi:hypothetical protein
MRVPWSPRAGHKAAVQCKYNVGPQGVEYIDDQVKVRGEMGREGGRGAALHDAGPVR